MDEVINYVMTNPENTNPNVLKGMLGNGESGAFETAEVEITNKLTTPVVFYAPIIAKGSNEDSILISKLKFSANSEATTILVVLYQGQVIATRDGNVGRIVTHGDIEHDGLEFIISGNGSIEF